MYRIISFLILSLLLHFESHGQLKDCSFVKQDTTIEYLSKTSTIDVHFQFQRETSCLSHFYLQLNGSASGNLSQEIRDTLKVTMRGDSRSLYVEDYFGFLDVNFDGYNDVWLLKDVYALGRLFDHYIFDPESEVFTKPPSYSGLADPYYDPDTKTVTAISRSCAGCTYNEEYRVSGDSLILYRIESYEREETLYHHVVKELINGKMEVILDKYDNQ